MRQAGLADELRILQGSHAGWECLNTGIALAEEAVLLPLTRRHSGERRAINTFCNCYGERLDRINHDQPGQRPIQLARITDSSIIDKPESHDEDHVPDARDPDHEAHSSPRALATVFEPTGPTLATYLHNLAAALHTSPRSPRKGQPEISYLSFHFGFRSLRNAHGYSFDWATFLTGQGRRFVKRFDGWRDLRDLGVPY
jgi:hypothetical protein